MSDNEDNTYTGIESIMDERSIVESNRRNDSYWNSKASSSKKRFKLLHFDDAASYDVPRVVLTAEPYKGFSGFEEFRLGIDDSDIGHANLRKHSGVKRVAYLLGTLANDTPCCITRDTPWTLFEVDLAPARHENVGLVFNGYDSNDNLVATQSGTYNSSKPTTVRFKGFKNITKFEVLEPDETTRVPNPESNTTSGNLVLGFTNFKYR